jgi:hypothetical protein
MGDNAAGTIQETTSMDSVDPKHVVVTIHGTWGRGFFKKTKSAEWCREGSPYRTAVVEALGENVKFIDHPWSGSNSDRSRSNAATDLLLRLGDLRIRHPNAMFHVACHSHAGNIVAKAASMAHNSDFFDTLTFFSTPFIQLRRIELSKRLVQGYESLAIAVCLLIGLLYIGPDIGDFIDAIQMRGETPEEGWRNRMNDIRFGRMFLALWISTFSGVAIAIMFRRAMRKVRESPAFDAYEKSDMAILHERCLIARSRSDEASLALNAVQLMALANILLQNTLLSLMPDADADFFEVDNAYDLISRLGQWLISWRIAANYQSRWEGPVAIGLYLLSVVLIASLGIEGTPAVVCLLIASVNFLRFLVYPALRIIAWLVAVILIPLHMVLLALRVFILRAYGFREIFQIWNCQVSVDTVPDGRWTIVQIGGDSLRLSHSTHSDPLVLRELTVWLSRATTSIPG